MPKIALGPTPGKGGKEARNTGNVLAGNALRTGAGRKELD